MFLLMYWNAVALLAYAHSTASGTLSSNYGSTLPALSTSADQHRSTMMYRSVNNKTKSEEFPQSTILTMTTDQGNIALCDDMVYFVKTSVSCHSTETTDPSYSCKDRCGVQLSFDYSFDNCSCDLKCTVYRDCCTDFFSECPDVFARSKEIYRDGWKVLSTCDEYNIHNTIASCPVEAPDVPISTFSPSTTPFTDGVRDPLAYSVNSGSGLARIVRQYGVVVDMTTGLAYQSKRAYLCNKREDSVPYFLPYVFPLVGEYVDGQSIESYVFPYSPGFNYDPYLSGDTSYLRACFFGETAYCRECRKKARHFYLSDLCLAVATEKGIPPNRQLAVFANFTNEISERDRTCIRTPRPQSGKWYWPKYQEHVLKLSLQERPVPYLWMDARKMEWLEQNLKGTVTITPLTSIFDKQYVLDFKGTPWKKMRCSSAVLHLDECDVLECSPGFLMTEDRKCFKPELVIVRLEPQMLVENSSAVTSVFSICTCFITYSSILAIDIWELGKIRTDDGHCKFPVKGISAFLSDAAQDPLRADSEKRKSKNNEEDTDRTDLIGVNGNLHVHPNGKENVDEFMRTTRHDSDDHSGHWDIRYISRLQALLTMTLLQRKDSCDDSYSKLLICFEKAHESVPEKGKHSICFSFTSDDFQTSAHLEEGCSVVENEATCQSNKGEVIQLSAIHESILFVLLLHVTNSYIVIVGWY